MDRIVDLANCEQVGEPLDGMRCGHGSFLDRYEWGYLCGNCGASWKFKEQKEDK